MIRIGMLRWLLIRVLLVEVVLGMGLILMVLKVGLRLIYKHLLRVLVVGRPVPVVMLLQRR
jgi:hypothetical protein